MAIKTKKKWSASLDAMIGDVLQRAMAEGPGLQEEYLPECGSGRDF